MQNHKLVNIYGLAEETGLSVRGLRTLVQKRAIRFIKTGHRSMLFNTEKVLRDLQGFEIPATANRKAGK